MYMLFSDPIKMGVINLEDPKKNQTRPFKVISEMFKKDFRRCADDNINSEQKLLDQYNQIHKLLKEVGKEDDIKEIEVEVCYIKCWDKDLNERPSAEVFCEVLRLWERDKETLKN
ncbi:hypothetical protein C2G38_2034869 [Gigaspora rosea]|uniref:Uncharacterized protein n=1 Tax=Gigaspora rosea TaxID=44941 RepID=A0A397VNW5_9GLOM|nr:hypothetical protein C2G38_2034869 [Gigaspora rosea]